MSTCHLPNDPHLEHLRNQAKALQRDFRARGDAAWQRVREHHPRAEQLLRHPESFTRADAQLVVARSYRFPSWRRLRQHLELVSRLSRAPHRQPVGAAPATPAGLADELLRLACLTYGDDRPTRVAGAHELLVEHPQLATANVHTMAAVGEVAALRAQLAADPAQVHAEGGPFAWEPLLYCAYSRLEDTASGRSTLEAARVLLGHGADPAAGYLWEGQNPFTALTGAFGNGEGDQPPHPHRLELARLLLEHGADANDSQALYNCGFQPPGGDDVSHLELLFEYGLGRGTGGVWHERLGPVHPSPAQLVEDELLLAAATNRPRAARLVLAHLPDLPGVDIDGHGTGHPRFDGRTALELAVLLGNTGVASQLVAAGARQPELGPMERFVAACMRGDRTEVSELLAAEPGVAAAVKAERPDLIIHAAELGRRPAVRLLAEMGFDVNVVRRTAPLHLPAWHGDLAMVQELVALGADVNVRDQEHDATPLGWAEYHHQPEVAAYLRPRTT